MAFNKQTKILQEKFGNPMMPDDAVFGPKIGSYAGDPPYGAPSEGVADLEMVSTCPTCGMMATSIDGSCGCEGTCAKCGMLPSTVDAKCGCGNEISEAEAKMCDQCGMDEAVCECGDSSLDEAKKKKGPSKKTAQKILRGTKTFGQKMKKVEKWAEDPAAAAAWMTHKATGKWPSQK